MPKCAGIILAGGQSRRMGGGDKTLLELGDGHTLLDHVINRLRPQVDVVALNANGNSARFAQFGLEVVPDSIDGFAGPLAGVLAGLDWAADLGAEHVLSVAADTPFFPKDLCERLRDAGAPIAMAATPDPGRGRMRHPTFALWPVVLRHALRDALGAGVRKVVAFTDEHACTLVDFPATPFDPFFNVNTPQDMEHAKQRAQELIT